MSLPNSLKSRVISATHFPSRRISAKESRYSRGPVRAPSPFDKARDCEIHWSCSPGHYDNHPISMNSSFMYTGHTSGIQFLITFWSWWYSGPLCNWLDSQIWMMPSENLEHSVNMRTVGFATGSTSQRGVFIFKSWGTSLQIAFIHTQRACALSLFFNMDLSGFSHIPHPSLVSFCDPGAHISKMLIRSRAATSGPQEATQYKLIVQTL